MNEQNDFWEKTLKRREEVVHRSIAGETILVPVSGRLADMQRIFTLNPVADFIWKQLDGRQRLGDIRDQILVRFNVEEELVEKDIEEFVSDLLKEGLITGVD